MWLPYIPYSLSNTDAVGIPQSSRIFESGKVFSVGELGNDELFVRSCMVGNEAKGSKFELRESAINFGETVGTLGRTLNDDQRPKYLGLHLALDSGSIFLFKTKTRSPGWKL